MDKNILIEGLRRLRQFGFQLRFSESIKDISQVEQNEYALKASATLMFNVDIHAFSEGGTWHPVVTHVRQSGLIPIAGRTPERLGITPLGFTAANQAIELAHLLLEQAVAADT